MIHMITWKIERLWELDVLVCTDSRGVQAQYVGMQTTWRLFLYPYLDDNAKTIQYFAFDTYQQKLSFQSMLKISGVGPKTAFGIANMDPRALQLAVETFDVKPLQSIPGVWPKTAKRLLVELKHTITPADVKKLVINDALLKSIIQSMWAYGFDKIAIKRQLANCDIPLDKENLPEIIKRLISTMS